MEKIKRGNLRADELQKQKKQKKRKEIRITLLIVISLLVVITLGIFLYVKNNKNYNAFEIAQATELTNATGATYMSYKSGVLKLTRDGAETINGEGKVLWNVSYNMKDPIAAVCGSYTAIADRGGTSLYIIDGAGNANPITLLSPIEQVEIAVQGVTAVLTSDGEYNYIKIFSMDSQDPLFDIETNTKEHGFPLEIALSEDGKKLVTSYMAIDNSSITSWVTFYNLGGVGENLLNNIAGHYNFEKKVIPQIKFLTNELICLYTDTGFLTYSMKEVPNVNTIEELEGEIESVFSNSSTLGFVLNGTTGEGGKKLVLYNYSGKRILEKNIQVSYEKVTMSEEFIVFYSALTYEFYDLKGNFLFSGAFPKNVNQIFTTNQVDSLLCIGDTSMERIQLIETKED